MKLRHLLLGLVLASAVALLSACGGKNMRSATGEELVKALREVAMSYYYKNPYVQYEQDRLTEEGKACGMRSSWNMSSGVAEKDYYHYTVCSTFTAGVYKTAFDYEFPGMGTDPLATKYFRDIEGEGVVFRALGGDGVNYEENGAKIRALLQPGDVIVAHDGTDGHAMLYLGDIYGDGVNYVIHCWGSHATEDVDKPESAGAIKLQREDELLFGPKIGSNPNYRIDSEKRCRGFVTVFRPFANEDFKKQLTPEAQARLKNPGICVGKYLDITQYNSVITGQKITLNLKIENHGEQDFKNLSLKEFQVSGLKPVGGTPAKKLTVKAGETALLSYTYEVTAKAGEEAVFKAGMIGGLETREIRLSVATDALSSDELQKLTKLAAELTEDPKFGTELGAVNQIYKEVTGKEIHLPETAQEYLSLCMKRTQPLGLDVKGLVLADENEKNKNLLAMQAGKLYGGRYRLAYYEGVGARVWEFQPDYFDPGDVIITLSGISSASVSLQSDLQIFIPLGDGSALVLSNGTATVDKDFSKTLNCFICYNQVITLRPLLVY